MKKTLKNKDKNLKLTTLGFTLIELLATIVILGLLALIVTPGIAKVIKNSKINTTKASLEGYVREIENASTLYLTDTGEYPYSINQLELDGKNLSKIENPIVELASGGVDKAVVEIDGLYCKYEKGMDTICREESFYSYMKNSNNAVEIVSELEKKYNVSVNCLYNGECTLEEQESMATNGNAINELMAKLDTTYYGIERDQIESIIFTNIEPEGEGIDISVNNTNDVLLYSKVTDEMYDIKIYSEKEIMFPENSSGMFGNLVNLDNLFLNNINTSMVTNMSEMFSDTGSSSEGFTIDLGEKFDTSQVTDMSWMFYRTGYSNPNFTLNLSTFDTSNVTDMTGMFFQSFTLKTIYVSDKWTINAVTESSDMFFSCTSLPNFNSSVVDKTNAHYNTGGYLTLKTN